MQGHEGWLQTAKEDLAAAKGMLSLEFFPYAVYHCQQSAEKALKGFLAFKRQEILKTHDLIKLTALCVKFDRDFENFSEIVEQLNPYATKFRRGSGNPRLFKAEMRATT